MEKRQTHVKFLFLFSHVANIIVLSFEFLHSNRMHTHLICRIYTMFCSTTYLIEVPNRTIGSSFQQNDSYTEESPECREERQACKTSSQLLQ